MTHLPESSLMPDARVPRLEDQSLLSQVAAGDAQAFEALYHRYASPCLGLSRRILVDAQLAEDAVQLAFLAVWESAASYKPQCGSVRTWILSITHHKAVDLVRKQQRQAIPSDVESILKRIEISDPSPEDKAVATDDARRAIAALAALSRPQRQALMLCYFGGYAQAQVARLLGIPLGTVKTRCRQALRATRRSLDSSLPLAS